MGAENKPSFGLTRRSFIAGAGALLAAGAVGASAPGSALVSEASAEALADEVVDYPFSCRSNCTQVCLLKARVRNGVLVRMLADDDIPDPRYKRICIKGLTHPERVYDKERLKYPMKRVGERGSGEWEQITWDEALNTIADTWNDLVKQYGPTAIAIANGAGNNGVVTAIMARMANAMGCVFLSAIYDVNAMWGMNSTIGMESSAFWHGNEPCTIPGNAKNIYIWSTNAVDSQIHLVHFLTEAREAGAKITVIDPIWQHSCQFADEYIPIRAATDSVLCNAMSKLVINNGWMDTDFMKKRTVAPFIVKEDGTFLRLSDQGKAEAGSDADSPLVMEADGSLVAADSAKDPRLEKLDAIEGKRYQTAFEALKDFLEDYTVEFAEEITSIPADKIRALAEEYATGGPATVILHYGNDKFTNGYLFTHALGILAGLTGQVAKKGAGFGDLQHWGIINGDTAAANNGNTYVHVTPNKMIDAFTTGKIYNTEIKPHAIWLGTNLVGNNCNANGLEEVIRGLDFVVWHGYRVNDTARLADIILPCKSWFEYPDVINPGGQPFASYCDQVLEPYFECKSDYEVWSELAGRLGLADEIPGDMDAWLDLTISTSVLNAKLGIGLKEFKEMRLARPVDEDYIFGKDKFATPTGRLELYLEDPQPGFATADIPKELWDGTPYRFPYWRTPTEAWPVSAGGYEATEASKKYPFYCMESHVKYRAQTQWSYVRTIQEVEGGPYVWMNPDDCKDLGIDDEAVVRVYNDRGQLIAPVRYNSGLAPSYVIVPRGYQRDQYPVPSSYQELSSEKSDVVTENPCQYDKLVAVELYKGGE